MAEKENNEDDLKLKEGENTALNASFPEDIVDKMVKITLEDARKRSLLQDNCNIVIPDWLKECEYPFNWHSQEKRSQKSDQVIEKTLQKIKELKLENDQFTMQNFVLVLKLVLEYYLTGRMEKSREMLKDLEDTFDEIMNESSECKKLQMPLGHALSATKSHMLMLDGEEDKSIKIGKKIIPVEVMPDVEKASLWAMKGRYFLYSGYDFEGDIGVICGRRAVELDPNNPEWAYLLAKLLRQKRRENPFSVDIPKEEMLLLEDAVEKCKRDKYLVYLAQVYRECATQAFRHYRNQPGFVGSELHNNINEMHEKALGLYKEALEVNGDSPSTLRRVGYGVMNLPKKVADYKLALKCLLKCQEICHSWITLHMLGTFYHRYGNDNKKALELFEQVAKAESHAGLCDMIRLKYEMDPQYDPCTDLQWGLEWEHRLKYRSLLKLQIGTYFWFLKGDFFKSLEYFNQVLDEDKDSEHIKKFKSFFLRMYEPIDLCKYHVNEALLIMKRNGASESAAVETSVSDEEEISRTVNLGHINDFLCKIREVHPEMLDVEPDPKLVSTLIKTSKEIEDREKNRCNRYENRNNFVTGNQRGFRPNQRGRGNYSGRGRGGRQNRGTGSERSTTNVEREGLSSESLSVTLEFQADGGGRFSLRHQRDNLNNRGSYNENRGNSASYQQDEGDDNHQRSPVQNYRGGQRARRNSYSTRGQSRGRRNRQENLAQENWREKKNIESCD